MRFKKVLITIKKELRAVVRDKKSFLTILAMPFIIPFMVFLMAFMYDFMLEEQSVTYEVGANYELNSNELSITNELNLNVTYYKSEEELNEAYKNGEIVSYVILKDNNYYLYANFNEEQSAMAGASLETYLKTYNNFLAENFLLGEDIDPSQVFNIVKYELKELDGENFLVKMITEMALPYVIVVVALVAATCATDLTAGEKERGTLETLLTFPVKSSEIVMGKFSSIAIISGIAGLFSLFLAIISLTVSTSMFECLSDVSLNVGIDKIIMAIFTIIGSALSISGVSIAISTKAKSFKEAQSSLQPVQFLVLIPMFLPMFGVVNNLVISAIPLVGQGMILNELFSINVSYLNIFVSLLSSIIFIFIIIYIISKQYKSEKVLFF